MTHDNRFQTCQISRPYTTATLYWNHGAKCHRPETGQRQMTNDDVVDDDDDDDDDSRLRWIQ